eukprot:jgi/Galph1/5115/GphlegSOOS_G3719.1
MIEFLLDATRKEFNLLVFVKDFALNERPVSVVSFNNNANDNKRSGQYNFETVQLGSFSRRDEQNGLESDWKSSQDLQSSNSAPQKPSQAVREVNFDFLEAEQEGFATEEPPAVSLVICMEPEQHSVYRRFSGLIVRALASVPLSLRYFVHLTLFLVILGVLSATVIFLVDLSVHFLEIFRVWISSELSGGKLVGFLFYVVTAVTLCLLSTFCCQKLGKEAEGSGIPQMKSILSGFYDRTKSALKFRVLGAKSLGLIFAIGGGLPVGWEGPNVHISCIISHQLSRLPFFSFLRRDRSLRLQMIGAACAVGLASSFGTPVGGVLYSLETTASFYIVRTFWKATAATVSGALIYKLLYDTPLVEAFQETTFDIGVVDSTEIFLFAFLGILMGKLSTLFFQKRRCDRCAGAFFVYCVHQVYHIRMKQLPLTSRYTLVGIVACIGAILQYPVELFRLDPRLAINELFSPDPLKVLSPLQVFLLLLVKFPLVVVSVGLPIPAGVFVPSFLLGSCFGRLYGELLKLIFGNLIVPGGYSVVAAAAFTTGVTRALSCAVIIFEVTGQLRHLVPTLIAVLFAFVTGNIFNRSLYDTLIIMKNIPYMPYMRKDIRPDMNTSNIMRTDYVAIQEESSRLMLHKLLEDYPEFSCFPVVNKNGYLLGAVKRKTVMALTESNSYSQQAPWDNYTTYEDSEHVRHDEFTTSNSAVELEEDEDEEDKYQQDKRMVFEPTNGVSSHEKVDASSVTVPRDVSPLMVTEDTRLGRLHFLFVMLMPKCAYVVSGGKLVGVVTRLDIIECGQSNVIE